MWIRIFPHTPVTNKPLGLKMGGGKGSPEYYVAKVKKGTMLFEMSGVSEEVAREAMRLAGHKLPVKTRFVKREEAVRWLIARLLLKLRRWISCQGQEGSSSS